MRPSNVTPAESTSTPATGLSSEISTGEGCEESASTSPSTSRSTPPRTVKNTGRVGIRRVRLALGVEAEQRDRERRAALSICGVTALALSRSESPALIPPMSGSTSRSSTSRPNRFDTIGPSASLGTGRRGSSGSRAARAMPPVLRTPERATGRSSAGTPSTSPGGSRRSSPRAPHVGAPDRGRDQVTAEPEPPAQLDCFGHAGEERVGGLVDIESREARGADVPTEPITGLEHRDPRPHRRARAWTRVR